MRRVFILLMAVGVVGICAADWPAWPQTSSSVEVRKCDPFVDCVVEDTNGDGVADAVVGKILVSDEPTAAENAAAANLAARIGYETTGVTLPIVVPISKSATVVPHFWIASAFPEDVRRQISQNIPA